LLTATLPLLACLPGCSGDEVHIPSVPTSYRLTVVGTDDTKPPRTISATID